LRIEPLVGGVLELVENAFGLVSELLLSVQIGL